MRTGKAVNGYTGSVFLTVTLTDSDGKIHRVQCEDLESIARRWEVSASWLRALARRGCIDGAVSIRGAFFVPLPMRLLRPGDRPHWERSWDGRQALWQSQVDKGARDAR